MSSPTAYKPSQPAVSGPRGEVVVRLEDVSVRYRVPHERIGTFKEYTIRLLQRRVKNDEFWALRCVNLQVHKGEVLGIIGRNGAGKSTLLKVVARVLRPTEGRVWIKGRVAPLLEFQAGFHPELTGRENILLNGALLGRSRREMVESLDRIVDFSELWAFIDAPLRTYSSGMVARLGFAIATDVKPDILIVDEVLSVGDEAFRRKSQARMDEFREQGTTILLVTHQMDTVHEMCDRALWLDQGKVMAIGPAEEAIKTYLPGRRRSRRRGLIEPHGGKLVDLLVSDEEERRKLVHEAERLPSVQLSARSTCDLELLATGAFSPLDRFMGQADYERVLSEMRLADGTLWPIPITLPVPEDAPIRVGDRVALRGPANDLLAVMDVEEEFRWDLRTEVGQVCGTTDRRHPLVAEMASWGRYYVSGALRVLTLPQRDGFQDLWWKPAEVRRELARLGRPKVVAFHTHAPIYRMHEEMMKRAADQVDGTLLIHPSLGLALPGDWGAQLRVQSYRVLVDGYYDRRRTVLSVMPLAERMAGPREALWHAIIRRNYGADHFIVHGYIGADRDSRGRPFYQRGEPHGVLAACADELGVVPIPFRKLVYLPDEDRYEEQGRVLGVDGRTLTVAQAKREYLDKGRPLPAWFARPEVAAILLRPEAYGQPHR